MYYVFHHILYMKRKDVKDNSDRSEIVNSTDEKIGHREEWSTCANIVCAEIYQF